MAPASSLQLCIFDSRRGQQEGHELDKILFFYPLDRPLPSQLSLVGLSEGLVTFSRIFSPACPCEYMEAEKHVHIFYECEPSIWMIMVAEKEENEQLTRDNAYRNLLRDIYNLFKLFHGSISAQLQKNPAADVVRSYFYSFVPDYIEEIVSGEHIWLPTISDSLAEHGTVRVLSLDPDLSIESTSLLNMLESWIGGGTSLHMIVLFHNYLVTTTLSPDDTAALYSYAVLRMVPAAISQSYAQGIKRSYSRHSVLDSVVSTFVNEARRTLSSASVSSRERAACQPLKRDCWWQESEGFLATTACGVDAAGSPVVPSVRIQESEDKMHLCAYQHRALTMLMLFPASSSGYEVNTLLRKQISEKAADRIQRLEEKLTKQWGGINSLHVPGYRYLQYDLSRRAVKASPPGKVSTLAKESLAALNKVRGEVDNEKGRADRCSPAITREYELCLRTKNNAWVSVRARSGHELYIVLEKASDTLLLASEAIEKFSRRHCEGRFSSD